MKILTIISALFLAFQASAAEINAKDLNLSNKQNEQLTELKQNLKAEVEPIFEEIETSKSRIEEIEKKYFESFWQILTPDQKAKFLEINQAQ